MNPTPDQIRTIRLASGLTQAASAALIYAADRTWRQWEAGDAAMPRAAVELWCLALVRGGRLSGGPLVQAWVRPELLECVQQCAN
jgi:DNA-binding transcriptional regulator YiaG